MSVHDFPEKGAYPLQGDHRKPVMKIIEAGKKGRHAGNPEKEKRECHMPQLPEGVAHRSRDRLDADYLAYFPVASMHPSVMKGDGLR